jgi:hypothetical protein
VGGLTTARRSRNQEFGTEGTEGNKESEKSSQKCAKFIGNRNGWNKELRKEK